MLRKYNIKNKFQVFFILFIIIVITSIIGFSLSAKLENDSEVEFNSELIYYLDVTYDGVDKYGLESNDNLRANVTSDYIYVEDKLPEGLIFNGFVTTSDKTFGAVSRDDSNSVCYGSVVDDSLSEVTFRKFTWRDWNDVLLITYETLWGDFLYADGYISPPTREGYTFERWSDPILDEQLNVTYKAIYKPNTPQEIEYTIEWYDVEGNQIKETEKRSGYAGNKISVTEADKVIEGYTFDTNNLGNILSINLSSTGKNILRLYFRSPEQMVNNIQSDNTIELISENNNANDYTYNYHGLHYNEKTRTISFKVRNLQAGCKLTIGIKTITPSSADNPDTEEKELRRDFYNFAVASEKDLTKVSNTVHTWMGTDKVSLYNVKYEYTGDIPNNAPQLPLPSNYSAASSVGVALVPILEGYSFTGWSSDEVDINNNSFIMPEKDVILKGSFEKLDKYNVSYEIEGVIPEGYVIPSEKSYYPNSFVKLDSLKKGDVYNGYRFLGWKSSEIINDDQTFIMPEKNIVITGSFEPVTYQVEYRFYDSVLPPNSDSLLPETKEYRPGSKVTLDYPKEANGYKFLGWYKESSFEMPEEDVIIYGEWKIQNGVFTPSIKKEIINEQDYYRPGDIVYYKITITNNADYPIKNVVVEEKNKQAEFYYKALSCAVGLSKPCVPDYTIKTQTLLEIPSIAPNSSIEIPSRYIVSDYDQGTIDNEVEIIGALADNYYDLDTTKEYKDNASFKVQSHLKICKEINSEDPKTFQFHIRDNENYDSWINLSNNECTTIYLKPNSYNVSEIVPQEYVLKEIVLSSEDNNESINNNDLIDIEFGHNYEITFKNSYKKKGFYHSDGRVENKVKNERTTINISVDDYTKEYDGENYEMTYNISGFIDEDLFEIVPPDGPFVDVGTYEITPTIVWKNSNDESKYKIIINPGKLVIEKRTIVIRSGTASKEYDGTPLTSNECEILSGSFLTKDKYSCITNGYQLNVGTSENIFNISFENPNAADNYNITKIYGRLTITPAVPLFSVIYKDGRNGEFFEDIEYNKLKLGSSTPIPSIPSSQDYVFMGWTPAINSVISADDANENGEIIYMATWRRKS